MRDDVYSKSQSKIVDFAFTAEVASVFPDMIRRSVPGYTTIIPMIQVITEQYIQPGTNAYDLGCSLGASTLAMRHGIQYRDCELIGVDNSAAMIERCQHYIALDDHPLPVSLRCEDILGTDLRNASVTTLNFTLQFVPLCARARARSLDRENRSVSKKLRKKAPWTGKATCGFQTNYVSFFSTH